MLSRSKHPYSTNVIGVCVGSANLIFGKEIKGLEYALVAFLGLTKIHADATQGGIIPGDLLVSGLASGHAIKADPNKLKPGMLVAKALEPLKRDKGLILCLLTLSKKKWQIFIVLFGKPCLNSSIKQNLNRIVPFLTQ